ncbi:MAG: hypothetical protein HYZ27_03260, partial [Deltaproteobacteria bacterium]|nr:hypothetical protein [Deltaproteobacteria bacterium]
LAFCMPVFLLSLTGLPPLAGFIGKFYVFAAVIERGGPWYVVLAIIGVVNSAISLYYYLRIVKSMYLTQGDDKPLGVHRGYLAICAALAVPVLGLGLFWTPVTQRISASLAFYRSAPVSAATAAAAVDAPK